MTATVRTCSSGVFETSWIESTAPSDETQSRGSMRRRSALRAYSIDEIGAMSSSPASSCPFSAVGTPCTSSTSASSRKKTGAMLTYEMRPSRISRQLRRSSDRGDQRVELLAVRLPFRQARARSAYSSATSRDRSSAPRSATRTSAPSCGPPASASRTTRVVLRGEDQRQRRRTVAQVGACDLAGLDRLAGAVEDVVDDLEGDPEVRAELAAAASPPPSRHAASKSFAVFSAQRSR